jgi:tetratricopeptide (TPR) repeat protein
MPTPSSDQRPDNRSFLRTGAEPAPHGEAGGATADPGTSADRLYPPPAVEPQFVCQLDAWERIGVWAVHIDAPHPGNDALFTALEACLQQMEQSHGARWFRWDTVLYGCALPGMDADAAARLARRLQDELARHRVESISVGVSGFPCLDFDRHACLHNACKALDHAAFFGPGSVVPFDAVSLNISGDFHYQAGRLDDAITEYRAALRLDPVNVNVYNSLGGCLAQKEDWPAAQAAFETAHQIDPNDAMALYNLGVLHLLNGRTRQALAQFKLAHGMDRRTFEIPFQIGKLLTEQGSYPEARRYLEAALAMRADSAAAHSLLGQCLAAAGHAREAITACKKAVKINPNDAAALSELGWLYDMKGENPEICITFCRQSVALCPENSLFRMRLAELYQKHNQLESALTEYEAAAALGCDADRQIAEIQGRIAAALNGSARYAS